MSDEPKNLICPRCASDAFMATKRENGLALKCYFCAQSGAVEKPDIIQRPEKVQEFIELLADIREIYGDVLEMRRRQEDNR